MKVIMYHYIRDIHKDYPNLNILKKKIFIKQINLFNKQGLISNQSELFLPNNKILLTFDDGFKDHIYAAEELKKKNSIGIFFITSEPLRNKRVLDTHKCHFLLSKIKIKEIFIELNKYLKKKKIKNFINENERRKYENAYNHNNDEFDKKFFKKIINYNSNLEKKTEILNYLLKYFNIKISSDDLYMNKKEIRYIESLGMIIGCHTENHILLPRLTYLQQYNQINKNKIFLEKIIKKKIDFFCYPFGGKNSYNFNTFNILKKLKFKQAYSFDNRKITKNDLLKKKYELPRLDCNQFIF